MNMNRDMRWKDCENCKQHKLCKKRWSIVDHMYHWFCLKCWRE